MAVSSQRGGGRREGGRRIGAGGEVRGEEAGWQRGSGLGLCASKKNQGKADMNCDTAILNFRICIYSGLRYS